MLIELGGVDAVVFTGGIGENGAAIRAGVCANLAGLGIVVDPAKNAKAGGEVCISAADSPTQIWIIPTNEELIVARQTQDLLCTSGFSA
jgi:acetate kinase